MSKLKFSDGVTIDSSGPIRSARIKGELYVIGQGYCVPVQDSKEAKEIIRYLKENK